MMLTEYFDQLGDAVGSLWLAEGRNEARFPDIAARALEELPPPPSVTAARLLEQAIGAVNLPPQEPLGFGQPPITVYRGQDFYISALYWLDGTTAIHQHAFSGAYRVIEGSSIHCRYGFERHEMITRRLLFGDLTFAEAEFLRAGDVRQIVAGESFIHSLFHLEQPTVTLVVRTNGEEVGTQFSYESPGVAWDPFYSSELINRQLAALDTLHSVDAPAAMEAAASVIDSVDLWTGFLFVKHWFGSIGRGATFFDLVDRLIERHASSAASLRPVFETMDRRFELIFRRRFIHDPEHRLFLALLMNLPDAASVTSILKQAFPDEAPGSLIQGWLEDLCSPALKGASGLELEPAALAAISSSLEGANELETTAGLHELARQLKLPSTLSSLFG